MESNLAVDSKVKIVEVLAGVAEECGIAAIEVGDDLEVDLSRQCEERSSCEGGSLCDCLVCSSYAHSQMCSRPPSSLLNPALSCYDGCSGGVVFRVFEVLYSRGR